MLPKQFKHTSLRGVLLLVPNTAFCECVLYKNRYRGLLGEVEQPGRRALLRFFHQGQLPAQCGAPMPRRLILSREVALLWDQHHHHHRHRHCHRGAQLQNRLMKPASSSFIHHCDLLWNKLQLSRQLIVTLQELPQLFAARTTLYWRRKQTWTFGRWR